MFDILANNNVSQSESLNQCKQWPKTYYETTLTMMHPTFIIILDIIWWYIILIGIRCWSYPVMVSPHNNKIGIVLGIIFWFYWPKLEFFLICFSNLLNIIINTTIYVRGRFIDLLSIRPSRYTGYIHIYIFFSRALLKI